MKIEHLKYIKEKRYKLIVSLNTGEQDKIHFSDSLKVALGNAAVFMGEQRSYIIILYDNVDEIRITFNKDEDNW